MADADTERKGPGAAAVEGCNGREEERSRTECGAEDKEWGSRSRSWSGRAMDAMETRRTERGSLAVKGDRRERTGDRWVCEMSFPWKFGLRGRAALGSRSHRGRGGLGMGWSRRHATVVTKPARKPRRGVQRGSSQEGKGNRRAKPSAHQNPGWGYRAKDVGYRKRPEKAYASALPPVRVRWHVAAAGLRATDAENVSPLRLHEGVWVGPVGGEGAGRG